MPDWKRKKDPVLTRIFYRPVSFLLAAKMANHSISANSVSYFSAVIGIIGSFLFLVNNFYCRLIGAILINIWLLLDCVDGNLARSYKKQAFGEFADGISSYLLVGFLCTSIGFSVYQTGGVVLNAGIPWIILLGAFASSGDSLMRLIYQKYRSELVKLENSNLVEKEEDVRNDHSKVSSLRVRIEAEFGIGGLLPLLILVAAIFNFLDLVLIYCFVYYFFSFIVSSLLFMKKAIQTSKELEEDRV
nr:CDP-alcohol phosphatidyltransferase family protein [uncultured Carboxylicivirga sp.]